MIRRWLLMLSASAAVHLAVLGLALVVGGAGAGSAILMDLVAEVRPETEALPEAESAVAPMAPLPDAAGPPAPLGAQASSSSIASDVATPRDERAAAAAGAAPGVDAAASTEGSMRAGSAGGAPGSSVALGTPGETRGGIPPEYVPYLRRFRRHVQESLEYPL